MKKSILNIGKALDKAEQKAVQGGSCPQIVPSECIACGGFPLTNGCCIGTEFTWNCLRGGGGIG